MSKILSNVEDEVERIFKQVEVLEAFQKVIKYLPKILMSIYLYQL